MKLGHDQAILAHQLREHRLHRAAIHLLVHLLLEVARLRGERTATAHPDRRADRAGARRAAAFLRTRLAAAATHFRLGQLGLGARATGVAIRGDDLVHQRFVEFLAEGRVGNRELGAAIDNFEFHLGHRLFLGRSCGLGNLLLGRRDLLALLLRGAFTDGRTMTWPPSAPGTAPRISSRLRSTSISTILRFSSCGERRPCGRTCACPGTRGPASGAGRSSPEYGATRTHRATRDDRRSCDASSCRRSPCRSWCP